MITKEEKFQLIDNILKQPNNLIQLDDLCEIACVSRSGYYYWRKATDTRNNRELQDQMDFNLILEAFKYRGYDKGIRGIHMRLLHHSPPIKMNVKKIQRLMRKYGLLCPIRKANRDCEKIIIDDWIDYYNNDRYQWQLAKLSPNEYYECITTGVYPLDFSTE